MTVQQALGDIIGVPIPSASGLQLSMRYWRAYTFITFEDDGSTILTLTESQDASATGEQNLAVITKVHKGPGVGGTWTEVTQTAANTYDLADDTTNDAVVLTVWGSQLSDGFSHVECTVDGGICMAFLHDPLRRRDAANLRSTLA